jgi:septal ring factor EnvC (AmiA/AmiB activator)
MTKNLIIIALILLVLYLYSRNKKLHLNSSAEGSLFSFEQENLQEENKELKTNLEQALTLQAANQTKLESQTQEISSLKNRLQVYEGDQASSSGEGEKLKAVLDEKEKLEKDLNSILTR